MTLSPNSFEFEGRMTKSLLCFLVAAHICLLSRLINSANSAEPSRYALLVGCAEYPDPKACPTLAGSTNDVRIWKQLLTAKSPQGFDYPLNNVTVLLGKADTGSFAPTRANILRELDNLVEKAREDVQVFILLDGHGAQQPIPEDQDPLDPKNPEPDGLDEVFLPADAVLGKAGIVNGLVDDVLGERLERMRAKGANICVVFDCCHSGSMTKGPAGAEQARFIPRNATGIPMEAFAAAERRARKAVESSKMEFEQDRDGLDMDGRMPDIERGSLVAFFAAQPFESAIERSLPVGATDVPANRYGLLSFSLVQTLSQCRAKMSYRALAHTLAGQYRQNRRVSYPTPYATGDLDREVLGAEEWPIKDEIFLRANDNSYSITAGALHGVRPGTVLEVLDKAEKLLCHVEVTSIVPGDASVTPIHWPKPALPAKPLRISLPDNARCRIVYREYGEMRLPICVADPEIRAMAEGLKKETKQKIVFVERGELAKWSLERSTPALAKRLQLRLADGQEQVYLVPNDPSLFEEDVPPHLPAGVRAFGCYSAEKAKLLEDLERDLPRIFTWENVWKVANELPAATGGSIVVDAKLYKSAADHVGQDFKGRPVRNGQIIEFVGRNTGPRKVWVTGFYLDASLGIHEIIHTQLVEPKRPLTPSLKLEFTTLDSSLGQEGLLLFVEPERKEVPNYSILWQDPLQVRKAPDRNQLRANGNPFGRLLEHIANGNGVRGLPATNNSAPEVVTFRWLLTD